MQQSHPHYIGEDYQLSIKRDTETEFRVELYMPDAYKSFITAYALEVPLSVARLFNVSVSVRCKHGVPVICMSATTKY